MNFHNNTYISITLHFIKNFVFYRFCLGLIPFSEISHTSDAFSEFANEVLTAWDVKHKINAIVIDNVRNAVSAVYKNNLNHIACLAHILQLIVKEVIFNHKNVTNLLSNCRKIVGHFKYSSKSYKILEAAQSTLSLSKHHLI